MPLSLAVPGEDDLEDKNLNSFEDYARLLRSPSSEKTICGSRLTGSGITPGRRQ